MNNDVDRYLEEIQEKQEIQEFVIRGVYPERLKTVHVRKYIHPKLDEQSIKDFQTDNNPLCKHMNNMLQTLYNIELELKREIERETKEMTITHNECPICMEEIMERNYVMPSCGHCVCIKCFVTNMKVNQNTGQNCSLCRLHITIE